MDYIQYHPLARRTAKPLPFYESMRHAALGCASDMGEVATLVKKMLVYGATLQTIHEKPSKTVQECYVEEIGDVCWFIVEGCAAMNMHFSDIVYYPNYDSDYSGRIHMDKDIGYWSMKGCGAAGKFADLVAYADNSRGDYTDLQRMHGTVKVHLANLFTCLCQIAYRLNIHMDDVYEYNITKLKKRYPSVYTDADALIRADKIEGGN